MQPNKPHQQYNCTNYCDKVYNPNNYNRQTILNSSAHLHQDTSHIAMMSQKQMQIQQKKQQQLQFQQQCMKQKQSCTCHPPNSYQKVVKDYLPCHPNSAFQPVAPSSQKKLKNRSCAYYDPQQLSYNNNYSNQTVHFHNTFYNASPSNYQQYNPMLEHSLKQKLHYQQQQQSFDQYFPVQQKNCLQHHQHYLYQMIQKNQQNKPQKIYCSCHEKSHKQNFQNQLSFPIEQQFQQKHHLMNPYIHHHNHHIYQMRPEEGEKLKCSRDQWDYELSQDLQAKKIEMLKKKYGGDAKANRAARIIQQAYRRYSLDKNFAKLRLEVDRSRLSRRFNEAGRSKTIWTETLQNTYCNHTNEEIKQISHDCDRAPSENIAAKLPQKGVIVSDTEDKSIRKDDQIFKILSNNNNNESSDGTLKSHNNNNNNNDDFFKNLPLPPLHLCNNNITSENPSNIVFPNYTYNHDAHEVFDKNAEFDNDMVAELPTYDETTDDDLMFEHSYVYSDLGSDSSNKTDDVGSQDYSQSILNIQAGTSNVQNANEELLANKICQMGMKGYGSTKKEDIEMNEVERKMYNSPVWKRKMEREPVMFREVEQKVVTRKSANQSFFPSVCHPAQLSHPHCHNRPDVTQYNKSNLKPKMVNDKQRKRTYRIGLNLFNKKAEKGICYLIERNFLDNRPSAVARFLIARKGLSKQMIGEYLGNLQKQFNMEVLRCFAEEVDLSDMSIDQALRKFQSYFRMPGEAQKIERLMEAFASQYCHWNPGVVKSFNRPDVVFLLAFACIMLNTDLHNKSIKADRKMKLEDFIKNLRGIDDGEDVNVEILSGMYERIKESEFLPGTDHVSQVAKVEQMIVGKKPQLAELHRRLVCYCRLYEVTDPGKKEKLGLHQREVFLFNDIIMVTKIIGRKKGSIQYSFRCTFSLSSMIVYLFESQHYKYGIKLTNNNNGKSSIMLNARNEHDRSKFVEDLKEAILEMNEMEALRIEEELMKQQVMKQKHCNYNRHSKDSGVVDIELIRPSELPHNRLCNNNNDNPARVSSSPSLPDVVEYVHRGSAGSLDSGLVNMQT